jgi:hypothetical protein
MSTIKKIFSYYWNITLLKESPENTPYSQVLLTVGFLLFIFMMTWQWSLSGIPGDFSWLLIVAYNLALSFVIYTAAILLFKRLMGRFVQTTTCLLWAFVIIHSLAMPLFALDPYLSNTNLKNPFFLFIAILYLFITLGLTIWQFVVTAHIYKHALSTTSVQSVIAAFGLIAVNVLTLSFWR